EITLRVERYVLPKFKVAVDLGKTKHGYRPGDHVTGTIRANYFFGKPVDGDVTIKATGMDAGQFEVGTVKGKTDRDGAYRFDIRLPNYFAGHPLAGGAARVLIEAAVRDTAGHEETRAEGVTVSESPLVVTVVPEGGTLIPDLENQLFILTAYADGQPAPATLRVHAGALVETASTDSGGIAVIRLKAGAEKETLRIDATDHDGNSASTVGNPEVRAGLEQILLRTERAVFHAGDRISSSSSPQRAAAPPM